MKHRPGFRRVLLAACCLLPGLAPFNAGAQGTAIARSLVIMGETPAAQRAIASLVASGAAKGALQKLGIQTASESEAVARLLHLRPEQTSALLLHDTTLGRSFLSQFSANTPELQLQMGLYNTLRANKAHQPLISGDVSKDATSLFTFDAKTGKVASPTGRLFDGDFGTGKVTLERPYVVCVNQVCRLEIKEFNVYKPTAAAAAFACVEANCYPKLADLLRAMPAASAASAPVRATPK